MTARVLILHAYDANNAGDGLLVDETVRLVREACGQDTELTLIASRPETFRHIGAMTCSGVPSRWGWDRTYWRTLLDINRFDLVVGVGGGYLRARTPLEAMKTAIVHGPQLLASARAGGRSVYLPQSVGPMRFGLKHLVENLLRRINVVMLRDDRSMTEFGVVGAQRFPDLAAIGVKGPETLDLVDRVPVMSVRALKGRVPQRVFELAAGLGEFDIYVQSTTNGNDDRGASSQFIARRILDRGAFVGAQADPARPRVVIAMRLHAALMALRAGHYVVHLAYERKGFGAFEDVGIPEYVHNVRRFDVGQVLQQANELICDPGARARYRNSITETAKARVLAGERIDAILRRVVRQRSG